MKDRRREYESAGRGVCPGAGWYQSPLVWALVTVLVAAAVTLILRARKKKK